MMITPEETIVISEGNISALQGLEESLSPEMKDHFENIKKAIMDVISQEGYEIKFSALIRLIDFLFDTEPTRFVNGGVDNTAGENLGSLKVFSLSLLLGLNTDQALKMFGEHYTAVKNDPDGNEHQNIRELDGNGLDGVKIYGVPFRIR